MRNFYLGETKDLGLKIGGADGINFTITDAKYEYKDRWGNLLETGEATVEDKMVYIELTPTVVGFEQSVTFILTIQSEDESKGVERVRQDIIVNVLEAENEEENILE